MSQSPQTGRENLIARLIAPSAPSPTRLVVLAMLLALWILALVLLYWKTVLPARQHRPLPTAFSLR